MSAVPLNVSEPESTWAGHPRGLFLLFFVEMWERFSYYGMRALLTLYMIKGFLKLDDSSAYAIYGAYTALVYATPFIGGMLADRLLGARRAVVLGGMLMAAGHLLMTLEDKLAFHMALGLLIAGNGFFKPNISTMVGALYPPNSPRRDAGFTIFYMGINLGAAMSPLVCGYIGETMGWHYGFGLATLGMLAGLVTFVAQRGLARLLIGLTAGVTAAGLIWNQLGDWVQLLVNGPVGIALLVAGFISIAALETGGVPARVGTVPDPKRLGASAVPALRPHLVPYYLGLIVTSLQLQQVIVARSPEAYIATIVLGVFVALPWVRADVAVYLGTAATVPVAALLLQNPAVAGLLLALFGGLAMATLIADAFNAERIERERMFVVLILMFFSMLFWAFFEQAGSSLNNFTDRNVDRIIGGRRLAESDVGTTLKTVPISTALLGRPVGGRVWNLKLIDESQELARETIKNAPAGATEDQIRGAVRIAILQKLRQLDREKLAPEARPADATLPENVAQDAKAEPPEAVTPSLARALLANRLLPTLENVPVTREMIGMKVDGKEVKASVVQAANPINILLFGLPLSLEPNTAIKFGLGLFQLGLGFGAIWLGTHWKSELGIVAIGWLLLGYMLQTTGELCLSPVGLSMVTRLSPKRMVSTVMGAWFLATAFSNYLAGMIAVLTGIKHDAKDPASFPLPIETVDKYGDVFMKIAIAACLSGLLLLAISPILVRWMHEGVKDEDEQAEPST